MPNKLHTTQEESIYLSRKYKQGQSLKPNGLWYSIGTEWISWCFSEMRHWIEKYSHEIEIDYKNILIIETPKDIEDFEKTYGFEIDTTLRSGFSYFQIDWDKVTKDYSGIEIRNYNEIRCGEILGKRSLSRGLWISAWDVSSGCIWDLSCITSVKRHETKLIKGQAE